MLHIERRVPKIVVRVRKKDFLFADSVSRL